jgi:hypothetical protein
MSYNPALSSIVFANSCFSSAFFEAADERECDWARNRAGAVVALYFRTADFFDGVDFLRGAPFGGLRASLTALPAWKRTALLAAIFIVSPLCGFRPWPSGI